MRAGRVAWGAGQVAWGVGLAAIVVSLGVGVGWAVRDWRRSTMFATKFTTKDGQESPLVVVNIVVNLVGC